MIAYVTLGADDLVAARQFYVAILPALGYVLEDRPDGISCTLPAQPGQGTAPPDLYIKRPFNGAAPSPGNGTMIALQAQSPQQVRALHEAAVAAGGTEEGPPGIRAAYSPTFYVAYLRDPTGNKLALFANT